MTQLAYAQAVSLISAATRLTVPAITHQSVVGEAVVAAAAAATRLNVGGAF